MAPGRCAICNHDQQAEIEVALGARVPYRTLSAKYGMSINAISRHSRMHSSPGVVKLQRARQAQGAETTLDRLEALVRSAQAVLQLAEDGDKPGQALAAIREVRATLELMARITGELDVRPTTVINIAAAPEWLAVRSLVQLVLDPYPEAIDALDDLLKRLEGPD